MAIGFGLNARGAMEIVLASAALDYELIEERVFLALVVMARPLLLYLACRCLG